MYGEVAGVTLPSLTVQRCEKRFREGYFISVTWWFALRMSRSDAVRFVVFRWASQVIFGGGMYSGVG